MLKVREENEKASFDQELRETNKIKNEISKIEKDMEQTIQTINQLKKKRAEIAKEASFEEKKLAKKRLEYHDVVSKGIYGESKSELDDDTPPFYPRPRLDV